MKRDRQVADKQKKDLEEARKKADDEEEHWENFSSWNFGIFTLFRLGFAGMHVRAIELPSVLGSSMHFVSTIFTTIGYGGVTPATLGISLHFDRNKQKMNPSTLYIFL